MPPESFAGTPAARILVVDDDAAMLELSTAVLAPLGYQVDVAEDGDAGWEALRARRYDLLITDHHMPKVTGVELVKKLRQEGDALPVILASGLMPEEEMKLHPWLQLAATLVKPFTVGQLLSTVEQVLRAGESGTPGPDRRGFNE
jgi:DNA-binding response OmpR family regulator